MLDSVLPSRISMLTSILEQFIFQNRAQTVKFDCFFQCVQNFLHQVNFFTRPEVLFENFRFISVWSFIFVVLPMSGAHAIYLALVRLWAVFFRFLLCWILREYQCIAKLPEVRRWFTLPLVLLELGKLKDSQKLFFCMTALPLEI